MAMLENFNEDKRKNYMTQFSDFYTGWSINNTLKTNNTLCLHIHFNLPIITK